MSVALAPAIAATGSASDGRQNPVVMISVGGSSPFPVILDTGSSGLRVYSDVFTKFGGTPGAGTTSDSYGLGGDRTLFGTVGNAEVRFQDVNGTNYLSFGNINYEYVTSICPNPKTPPCASEIPKYEAMGQYGTFGIRPVEKNDTSGEVYSPMSYLPGNLGRGFIVSLGNGTSEQLLVGLTSANTAGFNTYTFGSTLEPDGRYIFNGNDATAPFCYTFVSGDGTTSYASPCGSLHFLSDTGAVANLQFPGTPTGPESLVDASGYLTAGTTMTVSLLGTTTWWTITAGACEYYNQVGVSFATAAGSENNGVLPFFSEDVLYDLVDGIFGYRNNSASTPPFCTGPQL